MKRRSFVGSLFAGLVPAVTRPAERPSPADRLRFAHGVASGDPGTDRIILWTRVSGAADETVAVDWEVASDPGMNRVIRDGTVKTGPHRDFTVKVDAGGLPAGETLYYRFSTSRPGERVVQSPVGRTRTLPRGPLATARFAVASCANHPYGYFHAYREISKRDDIDAVIHLGDYIYEYGLGGYATERAEALGRVPEPTHEAITLDDLRQRHAQYKRDPDLMALHAAHPMIAVWDDHEIANDAWRGGAQNHQPDEGSWTVRRDAAIQAWLEWMPVRAAHDADRTRIFRRFDYGDLLTLLMLDTRLYGRDRQPDAGEGVTPEMVETAMADGTRRLLGREQEQWLREQIDSAGTTWQVIGQQVMVSPTRSPDLEPLLDLDRDSMLPREQLEQYVAMSKGNPPMLLDTWNGYPLARRDFLEDLSRARNPVVLSGDLHTSMAGNLIPDGADAPVSVELMTGSITSPGFAEYLPEVRAGAVRDATLALNPSLAYMETDRRGWLCVSFDGEQCTAEWHLLDTVHRENYVSAIDRRLSVRAGGIARGLG
jgi:alkaline phosphatase D